MNGNHVEVTRWIRLCAGVFALLVLPGCGLRAWVDVAIAEDSTGTVTMQLASDQELRDGMAAFSPDSDPVAQLTSGLAEQGWTIEPAPPDGEWEGVIATQAFGDLGELSGLLDQAVQGGGSSIGLTESSSGYSLSAELGPPTADANQADLLAQASEVVDLDGRLTVNFPGRVTSTNGVVSEDGTAVTWNYDEESLVGLVIEAEARKPSSVFWWVVLAVALVLFVGASFWWRRSRRPRPQPLLEVEGSPG